MSQEFVSSSEAFRSARGWKDVATEIERRTFHAAVAAAREAGMSVRETAAALHVPKSNVSRHWRVGHRCSSWPPFWGSAEVWRAVHHAVWAHDPAKQQDDRVPYAWRDEADGSRVVTALGGRAYAVHPGDADASPDEDAPENPADESAS